MAFINWGSESPEQLAIRRRFEEQTMYEQMVQMAQSRAGQAPGVAGVAGGGGDPLTGLYGVGIDGLIYNLNRGEANWPYNYEPPFPDVTQITLNGDDGFLYAILEFDGEVYFIRIDRTTREFTFIVNNISEFATKGASSLYYEGDGKFIYLDNLSKKAISSIIRIELDPLSPEVATATEVSEVDEEVTGYILRNLFLYEGATWAVAIDTGSPAGFITGPFDIELGTFDYSNILAPSPSESNINIASIDAVLGVVEHNGVVYVDAVWSDPEESYDFGLFKMDTDNGGAVAPYYLTFVKDLNITEAEDVPIVSITRF
jgi:hypothetical protein